MSENACDTSTKGNHKGRSRPDRVQCELKDRKGQLTQTMSQAKVQRGLAMELSDRTQQRQRLCLQYCENKNKTLPANYQFLVLKLKVRPDEPPQWVKVLATKPRGQSSTSRTHMVRQRTTFRKLPSDCHIYDVFVHVHRRAGRQTQVTF